MKHKFLSLLSIVGLACCCSKAEQTEDNNVPENGTGFPLTITVGSKTKLTSVSGEENCGLLCVGIYRADGSLDASACEAGVNSVELNCTSLASRAIVVVNNDPQDALLSRDALLAKTFSLSDNSASAFVMSGSAELSLPASAPVEVEVKRLVSRVVLKNVKRQFPAGILATRDFTVKRAYLSNVPSQMTLSGAYAETGFLNTSGLKNESPLAIDEIDVQLSNGGVHNVPHYFYSCPRSSSMILRTRLVIEAELDGHTYYYPVDLPETMDANCSYELNNLTISKPGSADPDTPVSSECLNFSLVILPWEQEDIDDVVI